MARETVATRPSISQEGKLNTRIACPALLASIGILLGVASASAEDCTAGTLSKVQHEVGIAPAAPRFGSPVDVTIVLKAGEQLTIKTICFDSRPVTPEHLVSSETKIRFAFKMPPPDPTRNGTLVPDGDHELTLVVESAAPPPAPDATQTPSASPISTEGTPNAAPAPAATIYKESIHIANTLVLESVGSKALQSPDDTFQIRLRGEGFESAQPELNEIRIGGYRRDACWDDSDCNARHSKIRGHVESSREITLMGVNPAEERTERFQVCRLQNCTREVTDESAVQTYWFTVLGAALATLLVAGLVLGLVYKYLKPSMIEGESYIARALFIDKETNTYSLSKLQFYLWTLVAVFGYVYLALSRNLVQYSFGLPALPSGLPGIIGLAGTTAIGAQIVTNINGPKGAGQAKPTLADFVTSGDVVAADRVQFFVWTVIGATGFLLVIANLDPRTLVELPPVPESLLTISGISAFGYLGGKLARDPGPVVAEVTIGIGPDPAAATSAAPAAITAPSAPAAPLVTAARTKVTSATQGLNALAAPVSIQATIAAAKDACTAATAALDLADTLTAAQPGTDATALCAQAQASATSAAVASARAADAANALPADTPQADKDTAAMAVSFAQLSAAAVQALFPATSTATAQTATAGSGAVVGFGLLEIRGRTISADGNFKLSTGAESAPDDVELSFDKLQPSPSDDKKIKKPRLVERDSDSRDPNMAKRLLLVVNLDDKSRPIFAAQKTLHTLTITNPDSQRVAFKFTVPESQKPS
jgi:hypothetical protein